MTSSVLSVSQEGLQRDKRTRLYNFSLKELTLGVALGTGTLTTLRFGFIGISEALFAFFILLNTPLLLNKEIYSFKGWNALGLFYIFFTIFFILPVTSFAVFFITGLQGSSPVYVFGYWLGALTFLAIYILLQNNLISINRVVFLAAVVFLSVNLIAFFTVHSPSNIRFLGFAENPNQILYQGTSIALLLGIFLKGFKRTLLIAGCIYFLLLSKSDAALLFFAVSVLSYLFLRVFNIQKFSTSLKIFISFIFLFGFLIIFYILFSELINNLFQIIYEADEGFTRLSLFYNAIVVSLDYPLFGLGAGSFSGHLGPYFDREAHNTFLDFSMQFGILFSAFVYFILIKASIQLLSERYFFPTSLLFAYLVCTQVHFFGRHIIFWLILAIMFLMTNKNQKFGRYI